MVKKIQQTKIYYREYLSINDFLEIQGIAIPGFKYTININKTPENIRTRHTNHWVQSFFELIFPNLKKTTISSVSN